MLMGSWYQYFLDKNPTYAIKIRFHILYRFLFFFKIIKPLLNLIFRFIVPILKKKLPHNIMSYLLFEFYFKYANILGMLSKPIKYD